MLPISGIEMDIDSVKFDSAQWPLMLAFAFAGLADMLPPIRMAEGWLRNRAYRAVGIPVRLEQTMRNLIVALTPPRQPAAPQMILAIGWPPIARLGTRPCRPMLG